MMRVFLRGSEETVRAARELRRQERSRRASIQSQGAQGTQAAAFMYTGEETIVSLDVLLDMASSVLDHRCPARRRWAQRARKAEDAARSRDTRRMAQQDTGGPGAALDCTVLQLQDEGPTGEEDKEEGKREEEVQEKGKEVEEGEESTFRGKRRHRTFRHSGAPILCKTAFPCPSP